MKDETAGAGAYKPDRVEEPRFEEPVSEERRARSIHLGRDHELTLDFRNTAIAAGALGLGVLAYRGVSALLARRSNQADRVGGFDTAARRLEPTPPAKDNAAPRFAGERGGDLSGGGLDTAARRPEPTSPAKDNAAPRFAGERGSDLSGGPFLAASGQDDTADLVQVTEVDMVVVSDADERTDRSARTPEHVPTDLMGDKPPTARDRAPDAFRPDATAPVPPEMRESLRPATGPATGFAGNRGDFASGLSQADRSK